MEKIIFGVSSTEKESAAMEVINFALGEIERKYGTGAGDGETPKFYHNLAHTKNVVESARKIAELAVSRGKIGVDEGVLTEVASAFHDIEYNPGLRGGTNELESERLAESKMSETGAFALSDLEKVKTMILATIVIFDENGAMKQSETDDYLTKIMADADLSSLGQQPEIYWTISQGLLKEIKGTGDPTLEDQLAWAKGQIFFLSNHEFHTEEAKELFPHKQANIEFAKEQIKRLEEEIIQVN